MKNHRILFICHGNICRSPMAEFILKDMVEKAGRAGEFETTFNDITEGCKGFLKLFS